MANLVEIRNAKAKVRAKIAKEIREHPEKGPFEFLKMQLESKGLDTSNIPNIESANKAVNSLKMKDRREVKKNQRLYNQEYFKAMQEVNKGKFDLIKKLPASVASVITKGAALGTGVAGVVNTLAPNLFPTLVGYYAGSAPVSTLTKLGLISLGAFSTPEIAKGAVLVAGAAVGVAAYAVGKGAVEAGKAIYKKVKSNKDNKDGNER